MAIEKAKLTPLKEDNSENTDRALTVQFNPETLRISRRRFGSSGVQGSNPDSARQASSQQITGHGATMSVELLFDTSQEDNVDVLATTGKIAAMLGSSETGSTTANRVRFQWGSFIFVGVIDSMDETVDLFSESGVPLRSTVGLSLSQGQISSEPRSSSAAGAGAGIGAGVGVGLSAGFSAGVSAGLSAGVSAGAGFSAGAAIGTQPLTLAQSGDTLQSLAGRAGVDWKTVASANGVDNPRRLQAGAVLNLNVKTS